MPLPLADVLDAIASGADALHELDRWAESNDLTPDGALAQIVAQGVEDPTVRHAVTRWFLLRALAAPEESTLGPTVAALFLSAAAPGPNVLHALLRSLLRASHEVGEEPPAWVVELFHEVSRRS